MREDRPGARARPRDAARLCRCTAERATRPRGHRPQPVDTRPADRRMHLLPNACTATTPPCRSLPAARATRRIWSYVSDDRPFGGNHHRRRSIVPRAIGGRSIARAISKTSPAFCEPIPVAATTCFPAVKSGSRYCFAGAGAMLSAFTAKILVLADTTTNPKRAKNARMLPRSRQLRWRRTIASTRRSTSSATLTGLSANERLQRSEGQPSSR